MPNGRARYPVTGFALGDGSHLFLEEVNLANRKQRESLLALVPEALHDELLALAVGLAHEVAAYQQLAAPGRAKTSATSELAADEPWPDPIDAEQLFAELVTLIRQHVVLGEHETIAVVVWLFHTYVPDVTDYSGYLWPHSPVRACGKSTLLELLYHLAYRAQLTGGITAGALARRIDRLAPTMLLDELDTRLRGDGGEALRGILNTGFHRLGKYTVCQGDANEDRDFATFCPKVLAGIGRLWDTVMSRSIPILMERASPEELRKLRKIRGDRIHSLCASHRRRLLRWASDARAELREAEPDVPGTLVGRLADIWRPLLAIGESISDEVCDRIRLAALALNRDMDAEGDYALLLLQDVFDLFAKHENPPALFTAAIVEALVQRDDRPWPELKRGDRPMSGRDVASLLGRFKVKSHSVRIGELTAKGYRRKDLVPVFERYLTAEQRKSGGTPSAGTSHPSQMPAEADFGAAGTPSVTDVTFEKNPPGRGMVGVIRHADGSTELTPERIAELTEARRVRRAGRGALQGDA